MEIYVGNIPYGASDQDLKELFSQYGQVDAAKIIIDKMNGQSKGFGFVTMQEKEEAMGAINAINGSEFMGRNLRVNESRSRDDRPPRRGGGGGQRFERKNRF